jgi:predicted Zn-dependent peptidase
MSPKQRIRTTALIVFTLGFLVTAGLEAKSFDALKKRIKEYKLSNGMTFIVLERHDAPVASYHLYVAAGSANESYGITGISHLLEHMAFKGTKVIGTKDYDNEILILDQMDALYHDIEKIKYSVESDSVKLAGLENQFEALRKQAKEYVINNEFFDLFMKNGDRGLNAYTSNDATQYIAALPSNRIEFWMSATSDRFLNPVFREFYKERDVVIEERRLSLETQPIGKLFEDFLSTAFKAHPYHHSVVGHMADLQKTTRQDVKEYFQKFYTPSNIVVAIVGDVKAEEVFKMAEKYFGRIPGGDKPELPRSTEPEQWGERHVQVVAKSQPILIVGFHRPDGNHPDDPALGAMANIVGQGRSSWLYSILVKEKKIAIQTGAFNGFPGDKYPNLCAFYAIPAKDHTSDECLKVIDEQIERLKSQSVSEEELTKYKRSIKKGLIGSMKSNSSMASLLANGESVAGGWEKIFDQLDEVEAVTAEDVKQVAKKYLTGINRTVGEIVPESETR